MKNTINGFIKKARAIHGNKYDYSDVVYVNNRNRISIKCPIHGKFYQIPHTHLEGCGCPKCNSSHMENEVRSLLTKNNIVFEEQKRFEWLGKKSFDFYIPKYNIVIECQGLQHFEPIGYFGSYDNFVLIKQRDIEKKKLCEENGIKIVYYANYNYNFPYEVCTDINKLLNIIH